MGTINSITLVPYSNVSLNASIVHWVAYLAVEVLVQYKYLQYHRRGRNRGNRSNSIRVYCQQRTTTPPLRQPPHQTP